MMYRKGLNMTYSSHITKIILWACCFTLLSCATSKFTPTGPTFPPNTGFVKVFWGAPPEDAEYDEIGLISSSGGMIHEWTDLIAAMQKKAAKKGANAIIVSAPKENTISTASYNQQMGFYAMSGTTKTMMAVAIHVKDPIETPSQNVGRTIQKGLSN